MASSCLHLFLVSAVLWFSLPVFAADRNMSEFEDSTAHNACERLLEADLSGHFVVTNLKHKFSQLIELRRLGHTSAYTVSTSSMELASHGIRELQFNRHSDGWKIGDPASPQARVNVVALQRDGGKIEFRFQDVSDVNGFSYNATPTEDRQTIQGDILNPNKWVLHFTTAFDAEIQFTRVKLDRSFELAVSQSLKSLLATRLDPGEDGIGDYVITVEMKKPLMPDEAEEVLGTQLIYPIDEVAGSNGPFYRFAVPRSVYELLESVGDWTRHWEVAHIDAVPARVFNQDILRQIVSRVKSAAANTFQPTRAPLAPRATLGASAPETPASASDALAHLRSLSNDLTARRAPSLQTESKLSQVQESDRADLSDQDHDHDDLAHPDHHDHREN